jgi:hypothetical protein
MQTMVNYRLKNDQTMVKFIELKVSDDAEEKKELVNVASIGRIYADPQSRMRSIVELNYQSVNDAPVYLEVDIPYESLKSTLLG